MISSGEVGAAVDMLMGLVTSVFLTALCLVVLVGDIKGFLLDRKLRARGYTRLRYVFQRLERDEDGTLRWREENPRQWRCATTGDPEHDDSVFLGTPVYVCEQTGEEVVLRDTLQPSWATWGDDLYSCGPEYPLIDYLAPDGTLFFGSPKIPETINPRMDALLAMLLPFFVFGIIKTGAAVLGDLLS